MHKIFTVLYTRKCRALSQYFSNIKQDNEFYVVLFIYLLNGTFLGYFFFIIQRVKAHAILCPHQPPTRVITHLLGFLGSSVESTE